MKQGKHIYVSGRVQGVWYRVFVLRVARELQITGWVKNMDDGRVGIAVYGEEDRIKKFVAKLHRGPSGAVVELVECKDIPQENIDEFNIIQEQKIMKSMAVILSGCGNRDSAEIHESVLTLLFLDKLKIPVKCVAPNIPQKQVVNHLTGEIANETRNVLVESARIARGNIEDIAKANPSNYCGMIFPGGYGAGANLSSFFAQGINYTIQSDVLKFAQGIAQAKKPGGFICIAPSLIPLIYGPKVKMTLGNDRAYEEQIVELGCNHIACGAKDIVVDTENKVVSTPAYMLAGSIAEVAEGIEKLVKAVVEML